MPRYIDAEKAIQAFKEAQDNTTNIVDIVHLTASMALIDTLPAEDVAPIIHAQWIKDNGYMLSRCSICRDTIPLGREYKHKYCPNCGAKMDRQIKDENIPMGYFENGGI